MTQDPKLNELIRQAFAEADETNSDAVTAQLPPVGALLTETAVDGLIGQTIGHWRVERLLGRGGMSVVYLVSHSEQAIEMQAALKILPVELVSQQVVERFVRERQILVDLDHPNIAKLLDLGVTEAHVPWYVMAYFPGQDIISFLQQTPTNLTQKTHLFRQVCEAMAHAHRHGVVHRDIKPGNVLVNDQLAVKVLDFGIALKDENPSMTATGAVLGTPGYMSPEQCKGQNALVDARSDVFSMGTLFYHMLTGSQPFQADSAAEMGYQIIHEEAKSMPADIPKDLQAIIGQCLAKDPDQRYASASALLSDITAYLNGDVVQARRVSWWGRGLKRARQFPKTTGLLATFVLAVLGFVLLTWFQAQQNQRRLEQAERFVQQAESIKNEVRRLHMLPVHNVQPAYQRIRRQITELDQQIKASDANRSGLTDLALGSAHLSMRDFEPALQFLQLARDKGWQSPALDQQLGYVLAIEWTNQRQANKGIKDPAAQQAHLAAAEQNYLQPAVRLLSETQQQSAFLAGRLAWIEGRYEDAIAHYQQELQTNPWRHEAAKQISEVYMNLFRETGATEGYDAAMPYMDLSNEYLAQAIEIGRSDPLNHVSRCTNAGIDIQIKRFLRRHEAIPAAFQAGMQACENALALEPTAYSPWANMNLLLQNQAQVMETEGQVATDHYQQALVLAQRGLAQHPDKIPLLVAQIKPLTKLAAAAIEQGQSPQEYLTTAVAVAERVIALDAASSEGWKELGRVHWAWADYQQDNLGDGPAAVASLQAASQAYTNPQQNQISVTSQLNAALIEAQLARLLYDLERFQEAPQVMHDSISRRVEHLPNSPRYFSYHQGAMEDAQTLLTWQAQADTIGTGVIEDLVQVLVNKTCAITGVDAADWQAFKTNLAAFKPPDMVIPSCDPAVIDE
ncbi:serine/threonine-protein kinase [Marinicella meishanensis]|uniref:serine/threonine-protein kinase n=1 Tax=Marinicella meishanensis TaxID=2873263 RepID=UPI001CBAD6FB|nr:serine/threonine-protein kinase [Marinicella sp. NBU2979]